MGAKDGRRLALGELGLAMAAPVSGWWWAGVGMAAATLALVSGPWLSEAERRRTATLGPPSRAVLLLCVLAGLPVALAAVSVNGLGGGWGMAAASAAVTPFYAKALPGSLFVTPLRHPCGRGGGRLHHPLAGLGSGRRRRQRRRLGRLVKDARLAVQPLVDTRPTPTPTPTPLRIRSASEAAGRRRAADNREQGGP